MQGAIVDTQSDSSQKRNPLPSLPRALAVQGMAPEAAPHQPGTPAMAPPRMPKGVAGFLVYLLTPEDTRDSLMRHRHLEYPSRLPGALKTLFWMSLAIMGTLLLGQLS